MNVRNQKMRRAGFTLVELLVVIAIIGVLVGLLLPAVQAAREAARRMSCSNNLKQFGLAMHNYHDVNKSFPIGHQYLGIHDGDATDNNGGNAFGWGFSILPQLEQQALYDQFDPRFPLAENTATRNLVLAQTTLAVYSCPSDTKQPNRNDGAIPDSATSSYQAASGSYNGWSGNAPGTNPNSLRWNGMFGRDNRGGPFGFKDMTDGSSNTFLVCEAHWGADNGLRNRGRIYGALDAGGNSGLDGAQGATNAIGVSGEWTMNWSATQGNPQPHRTVFSLHPGGAQFTLGDGSVRFVSESIQHTARAWNNNAGAYDRANNGADYGIYQRLFSRSDRLVIEDY